MGSKVLPPLKVCNLGVSYKGCLPHFHKFSEKNILLIKGRLWLFLNKGLLGSSFVASALIKRAK